MKSRLKRRRRDTISRVTLSRNICKIREEIRRVWTPEEVETVNKFIMRLWKRI